MSSFGHIPQYCLWRVGLGRRRRRLATPRHGPRLSVDRWRLPIANESLRLPRPPMPPAAPGSFVLFPMACLPELSAAQQALYRWALEQAQEAARPSIPERDLAGVWN